MRTKPQQKAQVRRPKGAGSIVERGGRYYLRVRCMNKEKFIQLHDQDNNPVTSMSQALKAAAVVQMMLNSNSTEELEALVKIIKFRQHVSIPLESAWQRFSSIAGDSISAGTVHVYKGVVQRFVSWLQKKFPSVDYTYEITPEILISYIEHMKAEVGCKTVTVKHSIIILRLVLKTLDTPVSLPPAVLKKLNGGTPFVRPIISGEQMEELRQRLEDLIATADRRHNTKHKDKLIGYRMLFLLCKYTGMRISDAHRLKWSNVNFDSNTIWIRQLKTRRFDPEGRGITIPIHQDLRQALLQYQASQVPRSEFVLGDSLASKKIKSLDQGANNLLTRLFKDSDTHITMHSFRHTFISDGVNRGIPSEVMGAMAGHKSIQMTSRYTHIFEESKREAIKKLYAEDTCTSDSKYTAESRQIELAKKLAALPPGVVDLLLKSVGG